MSDGHHYEAATAHIDRADDWANRDHVDPEYRPVVVDYNLRLAQVHATLAVAEAVASVEEILARFYDWRREATP